MSTNKDPSLDILVALEEESRRVLMEMEARNTSNNIIFTNDLTSNTSNEATNIPISTVPVSYASTFFPGEGSSKGLVQQPESHVGIVNPVMTSENCLNYDFSFLGEESPSRGLVQEQGSNAGVMNPVITSENHSNSSFFIPGEGSGPVHQEQGSNMGVMNPVITPENYSNSVFLNPGEGSSRGLVHQEQESNMGMVNPIITSEKGANSDFFIPGGGFASRGPVQEQGSNMSMVNPIMTNSNSNFFIPGEGSVSRGQVQNQGSNLGVVNPDMTNLNFGSFIPGEGSSSRGLVHQDQASNMSVVNPIITPENYSNSGFFNPGEGSSIGLVHQEQGSNMGMVNPIMTSEKGVNSDFLFPGEGFASRGLVQEQGSNMGVVNPIMTNSNSNFFVPREGSSSRGQVQNQGSNLGVVNPNMTSLNSGTFLPGEGLSSRGLAHQEQGSNMGMLNHPVITSENCSNSSVLFPQNNQYNMCPPGRMNTAVRLGIADPPISSGSSGDYNLFPNATWNSFNVQSQPNSSSPPILHYSGPGSINHQNWFGSLSSSATDSSIYFPVVPNTPQFNPRDFWPPPPHLRDFQDFKPAWEGSLIGKINMARISVNQAKAIMRTASPSALTFQWPTSLRVSLFVPQVAVDYTLQRYRGPFDYLFFYMKESNNFELLYDHLVKRNLCAKIDLPFRIVILSPTDSKYHYIARVFPGDMLFAEPAVK